MAIIKELPTVNFDSYPGYDEFKFLHTTYSEEFRARSEISSQWGIVDTGYNPATAPFTSGRPLLVTISPINPLTIDIAAGYAITPSYLLIDIDAIVPSVPLPSLTAGNTYVVAVEYTLVASPQSRVNRFGDLTEVRLERPANIPPGGGASTLLYAITVANINDYNNPGIFSVDRKLNMVVIAIVNSQSDATTSQLYLSVDLTQNSYSFNRPWFTVRDVEHRSKIGNGVITDNNPHGVALQDLSTEGLTLYQQLKPRGGILAKDISYFGYAGKICTEEITLARWESDPTGTTTTPPGLPPIGGRYFVRLSKLPVRTGSLYFSGRPWEPIPYTWEPGTRIIILGALENPANYGDVLVMEYFTVDALEINAESPTQGLQTLEVKEPIATQEIIISGGLAVGTLAQTSLALPSMLGPIKRGYKVVCDDAGALILNPQPILASVKVVDLVGTTQTVNQAPLNGSAVYLTVGLTRAIERTTINPTTYYDLNLKIQIVGVDGNGTSRIETLTFTGSQWKDQIASINEEQPLQFLRSYYKYQLINSIALANTTSEPHNAGPEAIVSLWADPLSGTGNQEFASVASFFWTGTTGIRVKDERVIATSFDKLDQKQARFPTELPDANFTTTQELFSVILNPPLTNPATPARRLMLELDDDRMWSDTWKEFSTSWAQGSILLINISFVTLGQTIEIAPGKYLKIVQSGANPNIGEVNYSTSSDIFRNNIIVTINDPLWDSSWFATLGTGANPPVTLSREEAYPEGFVLNVRQRLMFSGGLTSGTFSLKINGILISVSFTVDNLTTLNALKTAINAAASLTGGVTAIVEGTTGILLNGNPSGDDFVVSDWVASNGVTVTYSTPPVAFTLTQPSGGILPTPHLPQRYPSALKAWEYLSRPYLWEGVWLEASISVNGDNPAYIGDFDAIEIAPGKVIFARVGSGATADPAAGQFLVDTGSISITMANLAATVNHPSFASGVIASVDGYSVKLRSAGMASTMLRILASLLPDTWVLTEVGGTTQYAPVGSGHAFAFLKALKPLEFAEWRFVTVEDLALGWSPWSSLTSLSPTAFVFAAPTGKSLYQIQLRLKGGDTNSFALYEYMPEVSGASLAAVDSRLQVVETILDDAKANCLSLDARISSVVDADGVPIQDPELTASHQSVILPDSATLKAHLDTIDSRLYFASFGATTPHGVVTALGTGLPPQLISGPSDINGNSEFITAVGLTVSVGGNINFPLVSQINGFTYSYKRQVPFTFSSVGPTPAVGLYYVYMEESTPWGFEFASGTTDTVAESFSLIDTSANFTAAGVEPGHLLKIPGILVGGQPLVIPITAVPSTTSLTLSGRIPTTLASTGYTIYNPKEGAINLHISTTAKDTSSNRLYLGEITWTGSAVSVVNYRYLNKYTSPVVRVSALTGSYEKTFAHNLGFIPAAFTLYFKEEVGGVASGDPKVLHIGDEAIVKTTNYIMTVRNRYANLVARTYDGTAKDVGYLQLII
jgi:hypothetical protein